MPSKKKCLSRLRKKYKDVDVNTLSKVYDEVEAFQLAQEAVKLDPRLSIESFMETRARNLALQRAALAENLIKSKRLFQRALLDEFKDDPVEAVLGILGGTIRRVKGLGVSADTMSKMREVHFGNMLVHGLEDAGLWKVAMSGDLDKEIMMEMFEIRSGGNPGISGSREAQKIAQVYHRVQDGLIEQMQRSGSTVQRMEGYIMRQSHDPHKVARAKYTNWRNAIYEKLDHRKTFGEAFGNSEAEEEILKQIYKDIKNDSWNQGLGQHVDDTLASIRDPFKIDKRMAKSRALHFKDGEAFYNYNQQFGRADLLSSVHSAIIKTSRNSALMEIFGTNPQSGFENLITKLKKHYNSIDRPDIADRIDSKFGKMNSLFKEVRGDTKRAGNSMGAAFVRNALAIERMRLLGRAVITTMADVASAAAILRATNGDNLLSAHARVIGEFIGNIPNKAERRRVGQRLNIVVDDYLGSFYNRLDSGDAPPGLMNKAQRLFFRLNGMTAQTIHGKTTMAKIFASDLGDRAKFGYDRLNDRQRSNLGKYSINEGEWDVIRQATEEFSGQKLITTEAIRELDLELFKGIRGERKISLKNLREEVADSYQAYITDAVDDAIPTPGAREEAFFLRGLGEDDAWGQVARLVKQFKTVPLTLHRVHGRAAFADPDALANTWGDLLNFNNLTRLDKSTDMQNLVGFMVSGTILGYMALTAKDLMAGRNPRDPFDPETIKDAFVQGGIAGIYGDFMAADYDDTHRNFGSDILGPTFGSIGEAAKILASARDIWQDGREGKEVLGDAIQFVGRHTPYQNLLWTRTALDYMILHSINENLNHGYSSRFKRKIEGDQGFWSILGWTPGDPTERLGQ